MSNKNDYKVRPVGIPSDDEEFFCRPFFAYGIFKEGQLAYSKIADCVKKVEVDDVSREMYIRDGVPLIKNEYSNRVTKGEKIFFYDDKKEDAYARISATLKGNIYKWDKIDIDNDTFNILVTENLDGTFLNVNYDGFYQDYYDGKEDPIFSKVSEFIREELKNIDYNEDIIFKFQMYYMLLWSAIDRYCVLKYDVFENQGDYLRALADDKIFEDALESVNPEDRDPIHSAKNASSFIYDLSKGRFIINYYYTIRCNVAHRGKEIRNNFNALNDSLFDLLDIFDYIIEKTFENNEEY